MKNGNKIAFKSLNLQIFRTADGSDTLFDKDVSQHYHSTFGAVQESRHIFIEQGFLHAAGKFLSLSRDKRVDLKVLEIGFGTGLNALLTQAEAEKHEISVHYTAIEAYPLTQSYWRSLNYAQVSGSVYCSHVFAKLHLAAWHNPVEISTCFTLHKIKVDLVEYRPEAGSFDLIYFDAFGPDVQPELWTERIFRNLGNIMSTGGILVTYSVKGTVVRALQSAGFQTEKKPGPPGKRHILRASKSFQQ
ncbi:MAG: tRNA (5-methylaminomethyl-2-thiouridine)(34)-methyltransferase MnmD [Bacteroidales bacterium]|nr:tRNA (5-methylaminomethyl-2-thiouridine)(34)-methyltransferase MnmD [Bacteroidales bacterium]